MLGAVHGPDAPRTTFGTQWHKDALEPDRGPSVAVHCLGICWVRHRERERKRKSLVSWVIQGNPTTTTTTTNITNRSISISI
jgi:hypothetical protein